MDKSQEVSGLPEAKKFYIAIPIAIHSGIHYLGLGQNSNLKILSLEVTPFSRFKWDL